MAETLLVSSSEKNTVALAQLLKHYSNSRISSVSSGAEARRVYQNTDYDTIIINTPLPDEFGNDLAVQLAEQTASSVIMIAKSEISEQISERVESYGVLVIEKPVNKAVFAQVIRLANATRNRIIGYEKENLKLHNKIKEIRLIDRAKCALIQYLSLTEEQAHKHIEKQAMDMRQTRVQIAESILKMYET